MHMGGSQVLLSSVLWRNDASIVGFGLGDSFGGRVQR
jgi:hypothetical protein